MILAAAVLLSTSQGKEIMQSFILHFQPEEENFLYRVKSLVQGRAKVYLSNVVPTAIMELVIAAKQKGCTKVATSSEKLAMMLAEWDKTRRDNFPFHDYAGSVITKFGVEFLILPAMDRLVTVNYATHVLSRFLDKFISPEKFIQVPSFEDQWEIFSPENTDEIMECFSTATFISSDNETGASGERVITCNGFTAVHICRETNSFQTRTVVFPFTTEYNLAVCKAILALPAPKVFQNGKYDISYLLRYGMPPTNYAFDTINMFHSWYSELPKDLGFIPLYLLRDWVYHKDERKSTNDYDYYRYNAKDCFVTALSLIALLLEMPPWALENFKQEFPVVFPCIVSEAQGIKCDVEALRKLRAQTEVVFLRELETLRKMVNNPHFNPGSAPQCKRLFKILGCGDLPGTGKIPMDKASARHPLNKRILTHITKYREDRKLYGTYLDETKLWNGRIYYAINPHGTDTGRLASKESHFWCGLQIQNIPRDRKDIQIKQMFVADGGFYLGESDLEQAEARDTAYLSGDLHLIAAVDDVTKDYHGTNASAFFGIPYEKIVRSTQVIDEDGNFLRWVHETIDKAIRELAKRTNHGANYNMGPQVMLDTMGIENVIRAKRLLGLPAKFTLLEVCAYLLSKFSERYKVVKGPWYDKVTSDVVNNQLLVGPTGWTRYCFGKPNKNKRDLNSYVAHPPQSLNAMVLNKAYVKVFNEVWRKHPEDFRMLAQIHDSILFQYRIGHEHLAHQVKQLMEIPIQVKDTFGIERTLLVPAALKGGATRWSELQNIAA